MKLIYLSALILGTSHGIPGDNGTVWELFDTYWTWRMERSPEFATLVGDRAYGDKLEIFTEARFEEDFAQVEIFLGEAKNLSSSVHIMNDTDLLRNLKFFESELQTFLDGYPFKGFYFPISYLEGVQVDFQRLAEWSEPTTQKDFEDILARYELLPGYMDQVIAMMGTAVEKGLTNSNQSMTRVLPQCHAHTDVSATETVFYEPFRDLSLLQDDDLAGQLQENASATITGSVQTAFTTLIDFISKTYLPAAREDIAISSLPDIGPDFYAACLKFHTSTNLTAEEIHTKGLEEVERIESEMLEIVVEMGYTNMSLANFTNMIRDDQNNYYGSPDELLQAFHEIIEGRIDGKLLEVFSSKPETKLEIVGMPPSAADAPAAFYIAGTPDGSRPGRLYVNTNKFDSQPKYEMVSLSLHETNPGHHLQSSYSLEQPGWPMFRKVMEDRIYSQAPSRFPINTAYVEGWALYSEKLGYELGLYSDPLDRFGHLSEEIFRAARLVVDTGMHAKNWTQAQAVQYMLDHTAGSEESIRNEITRYITWPGQATAYKIGQLKMLELREKAESSMGDQFNIKEFHDIVLGSAGPLDILEQEVLSYIGSDTSGSVGMLPCLVVVFLSVLSYFFC